MDLKDQEDEWVRRYNLPHVEIKRDFGKRYITTSLKQRGEELGSRTQVLKNKKTVQTLYFLPNLPKKLLMSLVVNPPTKIV